MRNIQIKSTKALSYATNGSSAVDIELPYDVYIHGGEVRPIYTGVQLELPDGVCGLIMPRSGLGSEGIVLANTVGLIDSDYRGEIIINLLNRNIDVADYVYLYTGARIAQILFINHVKADFEIVSEIDTNTERGVGGFGSTGK